MPLQISTKFPRLGIDYQIDPTLFTIVQQVKLQLPEHPRG
jgi:hypothetical protein